MEVSMALPLQSLLGWILGNATHLDRLESELRPEYGVTLVTRSLDNGTRQWRFSYTDGDPPGEVIVAAFPAGVGFPVHSHLKEECFLFLSAGLWTQGEVTREVAYGEDVVVPPGELHGWQPINNTTGLMIVIKKPAE
jgi:mannose-6-phosphate isomerase-like protein (cupin superfamily)